MDPSASFRSEGRDNDYSIKISQPNDDDSYWEFGQSPSTMKIGNRIAELEAQLN